MFYDLFRKHLKENKFFQREVEDIDTFLETWLQDALDHVNYMFICLPGLND